MFIFDYQTFVRAFICSSMVWAASVRADTSYQPQPASGGPYPASGVPQSAQYQPKGWKPTGGNPSQTTLGRRVYATPSKTTAEFASETEYSTVEPVTSPQPEPESENLNEFSNEQAIPDSGTYYVLLQDGRLQKVSYTTMPLQARVGKLEAEAAAGGVSKGDQPLNGYSANIKYQDVEPIRGPIYAYNSAPLIRIYK